MQRSIKVLAISASKGGTGKTTISAALSVAALGDGDKVAILDLDPLQSLTRWHELRGGVGTGPELISVRGGVAATLERLRRENFDWVFVDTPPSSLSAIEPVVEASDMTLIVVQASVFDVEGVEPIVEIAKRKGKPFVFVLNRVEPRSKYKLTEDAVAFLQEDGRVLKQTISNREVHKAAAVQGKSAAELKDSKASEEIGALWKEVKKLVGTAVRRQAR